MTDSARNSVSIQSASGSLNAVMERVSNNLTSTANGTCGAVGTKDVTSHG